MDAEAKETMQGMYDLCDLIENLVDKERLKASNVEKISDVLKLCLLSYLAYLAASDGVISWKESEFIGEMLNYNITPAKLKEFIENNNIYSTSFECTVPIIMEIFVTFDNIVYKSGIFDYNDGVARESGKALFLLYILLTRKMLALNGRNEDTMLPEEAENVNTYLGMLNNYIENSYERNHTDLIVNFTKNDDTATSDGVRAPRKNTGNESVRAPKKRI